MRHVLLILLLIFQISTASALAYTNRLDGFEVPKLNSNNYVEFFGKHFYGYVNNEGSDVVFIHALSSIEANKLFGEKFTTKLFNQKYNNILAIQNDENNKEDLKKFISKDFLSSFLDYENNKLQEYIIKAQPFGNNNYIAIKVDSYPTTIYCTSANDRLYLIMSEKNLFNALPDVKILSSFKTNSPQFYNEQYEFIDKYTGITVKLPNNWFYLQAHDNNKDYESLFTLAIPSNDMRKIIRYLSDNEISDFQSVLKILANSNKIITDTSNNSGNNWFDVLRHGIILCSMKFQDTDKANYFFDNQMQNSVNGLKKYIEKQGFNIMFNCNDAVERGIHDFSIVADLNHYQHSLSIYGVSKNNIILFEGDIDSIDDYYPRTYTITKSSKLFDQFLKFASFNKRV